ncbi:hypothetical protein A2U01_0114869, partial [Trifolium medium]|nr:hypothetical protein [Trifolium medium]
MLGEPDNHLLCQRRIHLIGILQGRGPRRITKLSDPVA